MRRSPNRDLSPLPTDEEIVAAVKSLSDDKRAMTARSGYWRDTAATANEIARRAGVQAARRLGNGAMKGSWSGTMSPSLRISPRLRAMARRGLLVEHYDHENYRKVYEVPDGR
jgi:hypothetical protein